MLINHVFLHSCFALGVINDTQTDIPDLNTLLFNPLQQSIIF